MTLGAGCARARAASSAAGTLSKRLRRSSTDQPSGRGACRACRADGRGALGRSARGRRAGRAFRDAGAALLALVLLLRLGALLLDSADAAIPVCAHGDAPVASRKAE